MYHRVAMWSGPRNISTALMRSWGNRADTVVCDEPLYGYYLNYTGYTYHPGYQDIVEHHETDWHRIIPQLTGDLPAGKSIYYQKQMAHHLVGTRSLDWTTQLTNVFLLRDPTEMLLSLTKHIPDPRVEETGLPQQVELFELIEQRTGRAPVVLDAKDVLLDPQGMLHKLCSVIGIPFDPRMLNWKPGIHQTDGIWARHWYGSVSESTGFAPYVPRSEQLPSRYDALNRECRRLFDQLNAHKLTTTS